MRLRASLLILIAYWSHPSSAHSPPKFVVGMPYVEARHILLAQRWTPSDYATDAEKGDDLAATLKAEFVKRGATEVGSCFPTGDGQCFGIWRRGDRLMIIESSNEGIDPVAGPTVYFYYQARLHGADYRAQKPGREVWDPRSADVIQGTYPEDHHW